MGRRQAASSSQVIAAVKEKEGDWVKINILDFSEERSIISPPGNF